MAESTLGIDFGSSYISIIKKGEGLVLKEDNLVAVKKTGDSYKSEEIGKKAKKMLGKTNDSIVVFSPCCSGEIISIPHASFVLKESLNKLSIKRNLFNKLKIIIAIPMGITKEEKLKYVEVCKSVGASEVYCIPKIFCTALGENINITANNARLIVDIGGGTVECAVINLGTIISGSTLCIGGRTMDTAIVDFVKQKYNTEIGLNTAQMLKEEIGSFYSNDNASMEINGVSLNNNVPVNITVTAKDIYNAVHLFLDEIVRIVQITINTLPPEISSDVVRNGVILSGGCSKMVGINKYLRQKLGLNVIISDNSENAVSSGLNVLVNNNDLFNKILINL